ncbi:carboxypeptidase A [Phage f2b1]|nr:carboxypeptidase A [Phage f2b1]
MPLDRPDSFMTDMSVKGVGEEANSFWLPPTQPAMPWGSNGVPPSSTRDPDEFLNGLYEPSRLKYPDYVTRKVIGTSEPDKTTGKVYNIYRYELTPKNYTKTIVVSAGTHGNEFTASFALARIFYHIVNDWEKYPQLRYIHNNVRLIIHPINNPWSFANNKRQNANGVDLNRNMEYLWTYINGTDYQVGGTYYKGTAPFSEKESQAFRDSIAEMSEALAYVDFHTINTIEAEHIVFTPRYRSQYRDIYNDTITRLYKNGNRIVNGTTAMPTLAVHCAVNHNMTTSNPEWFNGLYGGNRDSVEMTEAVKWFANVVIRACGLKHKTTHIDESSPRKKIIMYERGVTTSPITYSSTSYGNVSHSIFDLTLKRHGIVSADGWVKVSVTQPTTVYVNPILYQVNHPERGFTAVKDENINEVSMPLVAGQMYIFPIMALIHNFPYNYNSGTTSRPEQVKFRLRMKTSAGASGVVTIEAWRVKLSYDPTEIGVAVEHLDQTGKESATEGSDFVITFPDQTKYGLDTTTDE